GGDRRGADPAPRRAQGRARRRAGARGRDGRAPMTTGAPAAQRRRVIAPPAPGVGRAVRDAWRRRQAFGYFTRRFLRKRYARTWLGWIWIPLRPALDLSVRALVFGGILGVSSGKIPYFLWFVVASSVWRLFSE